MSELRRLASPLLEAPVVEPTPIEGLRRISRRRGRRRIAVGGGTLAAALVVAITVASLPTPSPSRLPASTSLAAFIAKGVATPTSVVEGAGLSRSNPPIPMPGHPVQTVDGKPAFVYIGAEYCPYCSVERWAILVALSRFGTFSSLGHIVTSSSTDVFPALKSWSFQGSTYTSKWLSFSSAEIQGSVAVDPTPNDPGGYYPTLDKLNSLEKADFGYDVSPGGLHNGLPFIDIANQYKVIGGESSPAMLEGLGLSQVAADLSNPSSRVGKALDADANDLIGAICKVMGHHVPPACASGPPNG